MVEQIVYKAADCEYHEYDRRLTKQFIYELDNEGMIGEILRKITTLEDTDYATSEWIVFGTQSIQAQKLQKEVMNNITEVKEFYSIRQK